MFVPGLIERKRDGGALTPGEWLDLMAAYAEGRVATEAGTAGMASAAVPMLRLGEPMGVVFVQNPFSGRSLDEEELQALSGLMAQAAVALSDARLYADSERWRTMIENLGDLSPGG